MTKNKILDSAIFSNSFVVLDLETTGLDTENDTIIEIAAIKFQLTRTSGNNWEVSEKEEKSMLINPKRIMTEEISIITGITDTMLEGKPYWEDIRLRVRDFIGNSIIVGHNVLFDVAVLKHHGIHLDNHIIVDTFELSEFFSTESESLNLGFLGKKYGIKTDKGEHRALGDTEICLGLFLYYLNLSQELDEIDTSILRLIAKKELKKNIGFFLEIIGKQDGEIYNASTLVTRTDNNYILEISEKKGLQEIHPKIISLGADRENELFLLRRELNSGKKTHIVTADKKVSNALKESLDSMGYATMIGIRHEAWCSMGYLHECINHTDIWERKLSILIGRILIWIDKTETGLLSELKLYGIEYDYIDNFRMEEWESNIFRDNYNHTLQSYDIIIYDAFDYIQVPHSLPEHLIIKDIGLIDDKVRRAMSKSINISWIIDELESLLEDSSMKERLINLLSFIKHIYEGIPDRPKGDLETPLGEFFETYFFDQSTLWNKGGSWLLMSTKIVESYKNNIEVNHSPSISVKKKWKKIFSSLDFLIDYHRHTSPCTSIILEIGKNGTIARFIPRYLHREAELLTRHGASHSVTLYGYGISGDKVTGFLKNELGLPGNQEVVKTDNKKELNIAYGIDDVLMSGSVILTTSMKHIREIGRICEERGFNVLMQGISGGKGKILSLFKENEETTILVGLIDTWKDEYNLWKITKNLIIAKLPFDPPSDPYYLARTVGMSNNFSLYSEPMVIIRINTLIGHVRSVGFSGKIYTLDIRLSNTPWGTGIAKELL